MTRQVPFTVKEASLADLICATSVHPPPRWRGFVAAQKLTLRIRTELAAMDAAKRKPTAEVAS